MDRIMVPTQAIVEYVDVPPAFLAEAPRTSEEMNTLQDAVAELIETEHEHETLEEARRLILEMRTEVTARVGKIRDDLRTDTEAYQAGEQTDRDWRRRARTAKRYAGQIDQALMIAAADLRKASRASTRREADWNDSDPAQLLAFWVLKLQCDTGLTLPAKIRNACEALRRG